MNNFFKVVEILNLIFAKIIITMLSIFAGMILAIFSKRKS